MTSSSRPSSNCAQRGAALGLLLASMLLALSILAASIVAAGWPLRIRVVSPRLGMPTIDKPGAALEVRIVSSLPFILPTLAMSLAGPGPQGKVAPLQVTQRRWDGVKCKVIDAIGRNTWDRPPTQQANGALPCSRLSM